jgi:hypothetical protein
VPSLHKKQLYAGLLEIVRDNKYYYYSPISKNYCKLTDEGKNAIIEYMEQMAPYMIEKEQQEFELRAKATVWNELAR